MVWGGGRGGGFPYLCQDGSSSQFRSLVTKLSSSPGCSRWEPFSSPVFKERASLLPLFKERAFLLHQLFKARAWERDCSICMTLQLTSLDHTLSTHHPEDDCIQSMFVTFHPNSIKRIIFGRQTSEGLDDYRLASYWCAQLAQECNTALAFHVIPLSCCRYTTSD